MLERFAVVLRSLGANLLAVVAVRAWNGRRLRHLLATENVAPFWDTLGAKPRTAAQRWSHFRPRRAPRAAALQAPAVSAVEQQLGAAEVRVIRVDAALRPEIARVFGVQTVPSTVVLAPAGRVVAVNQGFAPSRRLVEQLQRT